MLKPYTVVLLGLFVGCGSTDSPRIATSNPTTTAAIIPLDSPFAKIRIDEEIHDVYTTIGPPTSQNSHMTGKSITPTYNYNSSDAELTTARYKGIGTITFSNKGKQHAPMLVISIEYDPTEPGYYDSGKYNPNH
jgi:hypothetical protein